MLSVKLLLPLGIGIAGLVAAAGRKTAAAAPGASSTAASPGQPQAGGKLTLAQVAELMQKAIASADPKVVTELAAKLEAQGFTAQAADLRGVAAALQQAAAAAAGAAPPKVDPAKPATPVTAIPPATPGAPVLTAPPLPVPGLQPQPSTPGVVVAPPVTVTAAPTVAERQVAQQLVINQQSKRKWQDNRDLTSVFQAQESKRGRYRNLLTGEPAKIDGLYGPATAIVLAEEYGIAPPNPKYWPKNPAPSLTAYKQRLQRLAAADPARASEWQQVATNAKVMG